MEHVSDERKAFELSSMSMNDFSIKESNAAYNAALAMADWKDKQIDTIMITIEACLCSFFESQGNTQESITNFIDALKTQVNENLNKL